MTTITMPVGTGAKSRNLPDDVKAVQEILNRISIANGGPPVPLKVDGIFGPKTNSAIERFQAKQFGPTIADGRVDPTGQTLVRLNQLATPTAPTVIPGPSMVTAVETAQSTIKTFVDNDYTDFFFRFAGKAGTQAALYCFRPEPGGLPLDVPKKFSPRGDLFALFSPVDIRQLGGDASYSTYYNGDSAASSSLELQGSYGFRFVKLYTHLSRGIAGKYHGWDPVFPRNTDPNIERIRGRLVFHSMEGDPSPF
ncbi:MAG TPA: peptidoglycan-binding domain-containing protein [Paludibaculum sp.]|jgi:hypothetical protein